MAVPSPFLARRMTGRCSNGFERDGGKRWHAVAGDVTGWGRALCGAAPGARGNGWSESKGDAVTCPRCLAHLAFCASLLNPENA